MKTAVSHPASPRCWVCEHTAFQLVKPSDISATLSSQDFAITNFDYGMTGRLERCETCGFIQCTDLAAVTSYYEDLVDPGYEATRAERLLQERKVIQFIRLHRPGGRLLDVGAGSGILLEAALEAGFEAEGIEPSHWLAGQARERDLPVHRGTFPHPDVTGPFDVITLVDVIEHVPEPAVLLKDLRAALADDGLLVIVTPDVSSLTARCLGKRWWHYRVAHIGFFNRRTLARITARCGLECIGMRRPTWYFSAAYLWVRALSFLPKSLRIAPASWMQHITVPLNLGDSLMGLYRRTG